MSIIDEARTMRAKYVSLAQNAPDELLSSGNYLSVFDLLTGDGSLIPARSVRRFEGQLYRANVDCWDRADNWPDTAPALWTQITLDEWPAWVQPTGAHDAYNIGDKVSRQTVYFADRRQYHAPRLGRALVAGGNGIKSLHNGGKQHAGLSRQTQSGAPAGI